MAVAAVVLVAAVAGLAYAVWFSPGSDSAGLATATVKRGPLLISITEAGTIQNRERVVIKSEVEGSNSIIYLISEGTQVEKGDLLVELDASKLEEQRDQQQITVMNAEASFVRTRENLAVVKSQAESDIAEADLQLRFAEQDLKKYLEGDYLRSLKKAEADIKIADEELNRADDKLEWSKRLAAEGYITRTELRADEIAFKRAEIDLDLAKTDLELLKLYTHQRNLDQLRSDVEQAKKALERTKRRATADIVQAEADLKAKQSEYERQQARLKKCEDQIAKCRMRAPRDGVVVHATTGESRRWRTAEPLQEGQQVRERQELIYLPSSHAMKVDVKIQEASLRKVRDGLPVRVTAGALPGREFWGRVGKVAMFPDAQMAWLNPDLKVYTTEIYLDDDTAALAAGMSCNAEIIVEQHEDALYVPVQSIVRLAGKTTAYVLAAGGPGPREVKVGLDNNQVIRIVSGLREGEKVLLSPPLAASVAAREPQAALIPVEKAGVIRPEQGARPAAAEGTTSRPALEGKSPRDMTPEERRQWLESLTPEQREELRKRYRERSGNRQRRPREGEQP
jgi:HlyD family secretion protein